MAQSWKRGLQLGIAAFVLIVLAPLVPQLSLLFTLAGVASLAILYGDARTRTPEARRTALLGLGLGLGGFFMSYAANLVFQRALLGGDFALWKDTLWMYVAADVAIAAGFYFGPQHLAAGRSRFFLGLAFGIALAVSVMAALAAVGPADALIQAGHAQTAAPGSAAYAEWLNGALSDYYAGVINANLAKGLPFILFAWSYSAMLGRLRLESQTKDPWAL